MDINKYTPKNKIKNTSIIKLSDYLPEEIYEILYAARLLKNKQLAKEPHTLLKNKIIAIIIPSPSTKTSLSFEMGIRQMGGGSVYLSASDLELGHENLIDTANILKSYEIDGSIIFTHNQSDIEAFSKYSAIPTICGMSDFSNPCQVLSDLFTIWEHKERLNNLKIAYIGLGNNVANSLLIGAVKCGADINMCCPEGYEADSSVIEKASQYGDFKIVTNPEEAVKNADVIYTDIWFSKKYPYSEERYELFKPYQINEKIFNKAKSDAIFMHPLPVKRDEEVTIDVLNSDRSVIYQQAENKLHTQKAILSLLIK